MGESEWREGVQRHQLDGRGCTKKASVADALECMKGEGKAYNVGDGGRQGGGGDEGKEMRVKVYRGVRQYRGWVSKQTTRYT